MNLTLFFRLIVTAIFQKAVTSGSRMTYDYQRFYCPNVFAKDGFNISLQINHNNYCSSENGYRELGHTFNEIEFGYPSEDDELLHQYSESYGSSDWDELMNEEIPFNPLKFNAMGSVGCIPISILEQLFEKRGGIDWERTISVEQYVRLIE